MGLFEIPENCNSEHNHRKPQKRPANKGEKWYFMEKKKEIGKGYFEQKSIEKK